MKLKLLLFTTVFSLLSFAQDYNVAMQVSRSDLEENHYAKDSTANALVIYDYGNSFVDKKLFWLRVQVEQKIKILRSKGLERGEIEIKLYKGKSSKEEIKDIKGTTYNLENGKIVKTELLPSAIFKEENEDYTLVKFVLPNVKIGSVITYSYETQSRFMRKFQPWYFQGTDPVLYSEYNTSIPGNYEYNIKLVGEIPLDVNDTSLKKNCLQVRNGGKADCIVSKYVMKNIPAYKPEDYTTTPLNYISRIEYELSVYKGFDGSIDKITKTWDSVDKELKTNSDFGKQISKKSLAKNVLPKEISSMNNSIEKAKAIYQFVLDDYKWNNKYERHDVSVKKLVKERVGNVFEINLLLENLLSNEGFKVYPVLLSTRKNGLVTKIYPVLTDFNYVIVKVIINGKDYFLDATNPYLSFGELPHRCLNQYGRLIDFENGSYWQDIKIDKYSSTQYRVQIDLTDVESFSGTVHSKYTGYNAHSFKQSYHKNSSTYKEDKIDTYENITIDNYEVIDFDKNNYDFNERFDVIIEPEYIGNKIYLNPFILKFFDKNPFKLQERTYPIDFGYKKIFLYIMKIDLNDNLKALEIPNSVNYTLPNKSGSFVFNIKSKDNQLTLFFKLKLNYSIYAPKLYSHLKALMNKVVEIQKNTIVVLEK